MRQPLYITYVDHLFLWRSFYAPAALYYLWWSSVPEKTFLCARSIMLLMLIICSCEEVSMRPLHYITYVDHLFLRRSFHVTTAIHYLCWSSVPVKKFPRTRRIILLMLIIYSCEEVSMRPLFYFTYVDKLSLWKNVHVPFALYHLLNSHPSWNFLWKK